MCGNRPGAQNDKLWLETVCSGRLSFASIYRLGVVSECIHRKPPMDTLQHLQVLDQAACKQQLDTLPPRGCSTHASTSPNHYNRVPPSIRSVSRLN